MGGHSHRRRHPIGAIPAHGHRPNLRHVQQSLWQLPLVRHSAHHPRPRGPRHRRVRQGRGEAAAHHGAHCLRVDHLLRFLHLLHRCGGLPPSPHRWHPVARGVAEPRIGHAHALLYRCHAARDGHHDRPSALLRRWSRPRLYPRRHAPKGLRRLSRHRLAPHRDRHRAPLAAPHLRHLPQHHRQRTGGRHHVHVPSGHPRHLRAARRAAAHPVQHSRCHSGQESAPALEEHAAGLRHRPWHTVVGRHHPRDAQADAPEWRPGEHRRLHRPTLRHDPPGR